MPPKPPLPTNTCLDCGHVNEGERIYCHNCGSKLDRSFIINEKVLRKESSAKLQKRVSRAIKPSKGVVRKLVYAGLSGIFYGALTAAVILAVLPPKDVPPLTRPEIAASRVARLLENIVDQRTGASYSFTEDEVNAFLRKAIQRSKKDDSLLSIFVKFERVYVAFKEAIVQVSIQGDSYGYPSFATFSYTVGFENNALNTKLVGLKIGRLSVASEVLPYLEGYKEVWQAPILSKLKAQQKLISGLSDIYVKENLIVLTSSKPLSKPAPLQKPAALESSPLKTSSLKTATSLDRPAPNNVPQTQTR